MAKIPDETLRTVLSLQGQLLGVINEAKATEYRILVEFGETETTIATLEALQNTTERLRNSYSRLHILMLRVAEAQPLADTATLELFGRAIDQAQASLDSAVASVREAKGDVGLL